MRAGRLRPPASLRPGSSDRSSRSDHFTTRRLPAIEAVHHAEARLALYYGLIGLGAVLLVLGAVLLARKPRTRAAPVPGHAAA
jgi:hypothetical protein